MHKLKTTDKVKVNGRLYTVWEGPRGGTYIQRKGVFVSLRTLQNQTGGGHIGYLFTPKSHKEYKSPPTEITVLHEHIRTEVERFRSLKTIVDGVFSMYKTQYTHDVTHIDWLETQSIVVEDIDNLTTILQEIQRINAKYSSIELHDDE
jgi:hypothetical protein